MLTETRNEELYAGKLSEIVKILKSQGFEKIRTDLPDFPDPAPLVRQSDEHAYIPDITAVKNGGKYYIEVAKRTSDEVKLVGKWKLLATLASMKKGELKIFIPRGELSFTRRVLTKYNIEATMIKMF
ncbi:MAG: hypothetical protein AAFN10_02475 [Bacteroidota bacterium]